LVHWRADCPGRQPRVHPLLLARAWRKQLEEDPRLTKARIAASEGLSRARVTQLMNLLNLPEDMQQIVLNPLAPLENQVFTERNLRAVASCPDRKTQVSRWQELIQSPGFTSHH